MRVLLIAWVLTAFSSLAYSQGCTVSTSNQILLTGDDGFGNCTYSIDILFTEGQGPDNMTLTFSSTDATILTGAGPHVCACSGNTYTLTFEAACSGTVTFVADHDNSGSGNDCSVTTDPITLPVEWQSINISSLNRQEINIRWTTSKEINNDHFEVQFSTNGRAYETIEVVAGSGTTSTTKYYSTTHYFPHTQTLDYRIKQVDYDGHFTFSPVRSISHKGGTDIDVYPNPTSDYLTVSGITQEQAIKIIDYSGAQIMLQVGGTIDISHLVPGNYFVVIKDANKTIPLIKID